MTYQEHCIHSGKDGILVDPTLQLDWIFAGVRRYAHEHPGGAVAVHIHGGLVSRQNGEKGARQSYQAYLDGGAYPLFFVWQSGAFETVRNNPDEIIPWVLRQIGEERVFRRLRRVLEWFIGDRVARQSRAGSDAVLASFLIEFPGATSALAWPDVDAFDYTGLAPLTPADEAYLEATLARDAELVSELEALRAQLQFQAFDASAEFDVEPDGSRNLPTLMSQDVIDEISGGGGIGIESTVGFGFFRRGARVGRRVIARLIEGRDHGDLYSTIVEEVLRELYADRLVTMIWEFMKSDTLETFAAQPPKPLRAGAEFLRELNELVTEYPHLRVSLIGHSTGAIFINNLLAHADGALPTNFAFRHVVFLAPACTFGGFADVILRRSHLVQNFRIYTMTDHNERRDDLLGGLYQNSLLYFISGVLERDDDGDYPILGMQRFYDANGPDALNVYPGVREVRAWALAAPHRIIWSTTGEAEPGLGADSTTHGGFNDLKDKNGSRLQTMASVLHLVAR